MTHGNSNFEKSLQEKFGNFTPKVPESVWSSLEAKIEADIRVKNRASTVSRKAKWASVAAAAVIVVGSTIWWISLDRNVPTSASVTLPIAQHIETLRNHPIETQLTQPVGTADIVESSSSAKTSMLAHTLSVDSKPDAISVETPTEQNLPEANSNNVENTPQPLADSQQTESVHKATVQPPTRPTPQPSTHKSTTKSASESRRTILSLYTTLGNNDSRTTSVPGSVSRATFSSNQDTPPASYGNMVLAYPPDQISALSHDFPVTVGVDVSWKLTRRIALQSGISYSYLRSTGEISGNFQYKLTQKVHYLGIPLGVEWSILSGSRGALYAKVSGTAEWAVSAHQELREINANAAPADKKEITVAADGTQWSYGAAFGAFYRITPRIGIYAEPGVAHYVKNSRQPETYYTQDDAVFRLKAGLKFTF